MQVDNRLICQSGTQELATLLPDNTAITKITLVDGCTLTDLNVLFGTMRGYFITHLCIDGKNAKVTLASACCKKIALLPSLTSLSLRNVALSAQDLVPLKRLQKLSLELISDATCEEVFAAIPALTNLTRLHFDQPLKEAKQVRQLFPLKKLETFDVELDFGGPRIPRLLIENLPALRFVRHLPLAAEELKDFYASLKFTENRLLRRQFSLQDARKHDIFYYTRQQQVDENLIVEHVRKEGAWPLQLLQWLHYAIAEVRPLLFEKFIHCDLDLNRPLANGKLALVEAVKGVCYQKESADRRRLRQFAEKLLEAGADPNLPDAEGNYALMYAIRACDASLVRKLLKADASPDLELFSSKLQERAKGTLFAQHTSFTPLLLACLSWLRHPEYAGRAHEIALMLIEAKADVALPNKDGQTLLHLIMQADLPFPVEVVDALLKAGASTTVKADDGFTPLRYLLRAISDLDKAKPCDTKLLEAKFGYLKAMIERGETRVKNFKLLLDIATSRGVISIINYLRDKIAK